VRYARRQSTFLLTLDLKGAFPSVPLVFALERFRNLGLRGVGLRFLRSLLGNNAVCIGGLPDGTYSERVHRPRGIGEGYVFSPMVFAVLSTLLLEDLLRLDIGLRYSRGQSLKTLFYVDDVALLGSTLPELGVGLDCVLQKCYRYRLTINRKNAVL